LIRAGQEIVLPVKEITVGDTIVVETGDRIPAPGVITHGTALVKRVDAQSAAFSTHLYSGHDQVKVNPGQWINADTIILAGRIQILVVPR
jgi:cation transport ATPase